MIVVMMLLTMPGKQRAAPRAPAAWLCVGGTSLAPRADPAATSTTIGGARQAGFARERSSATRKSTTRWAPSSHSAPHGCPAFRALCRRKIAGAAKMSTSAGTSRAIRAPHASTRLAVIDARAPTPSLITVTSSRRAPSRTAFGKMVMLSRFVVLSVSLTRKVSLLQRAGPTPVRGGRRRHAASAERSPSLQTAGQNGRRDDAGGAGGHVQRALSDGAGVHEMQCYNY